MNPDLNPKLNSKTPTVNWLVLKFGGSSVGDPKHWPTITQQVELTLAKGYRPFLVLSALKNVSNLLEALLHQALAGVYPMPIEHLKEMHLSFAAQIGLDLAMELAPRFEQLTQDCREIYLDKSISPKLHAKVLATGELLSSTIGYFYLKSRNINCHWKDARTLLKSDQKKLQHDDSWHHYTNTICRYRLENSNLSNSYNSEAIESLNQKDHQVIVTQGFIASDENNDTVLLGREGSDTSAAYFGALLNAKEIQIWTDVPGVFSCNPRDNNQARLLRHLNYTEANQMAQLGAKVIHPRALQPALDCQIPILVKSTHLPTYQGTIINAALAKTPAIKAVVSESPIILFSSVNSTDSARLFENKLMSKLMSLGYDLVIKDVVEKESDRTASMVMRYANSDRIEPDLQTLNQLLKVSSINLSINASTSSPTAELKKAISIQNGLSLVSVVGVSNQPKWQLEIEDFCKQQSTLNFEQLICSLKSGRVSLLVPENESIQWSQLIHKHFIEANISDEFGENWVSFC